MLSRLRAARDTDRVASIFGSPQISEQPYLSVTNGPAAVPLRNAQLELWNADHVFASTTDWQGKFAVYSVPPGTYRLRAALPASLEFTRPIVNDPPAPISVVAGDCSEYNLTALPTSRIRGRVIGPNGKPLRAADVELFRPDKYQPSPLLMQWQESQDANGYFEFLHVTPGDYILVYNNSEQQETNRSRRRCFYPGVSDVARARSIHLEPGQQIGDADIHIQGECSKP
ncbi:MAG: carboxypeptidase-like regulatory domain-containing protein [Candidatus Acidiferrales bacterium]